MSSLKAFFLSFRVCLNSDTYRETASGVPLMSGCVIQTLVALVFCSSGVASMTFQFADLRSSAMDCAPLSMAERPFSEAFPSEVHWLLASFRRHHLGAVAVSSPEFSDVVAPEANEVGVQS